MFWDYEVTPEEEEKFLRAIAEKIHQTGMDVVGILFLETVKPLSFVGTQLGRFFLSPYLPALGEKVGMSGEKFLQVFEKHDNVEKLILMLEELADEEREKSKKEREEARERKAKEAESGEKKPAKKGWRRFLPF